MSSQFLRHARTSRMGKPLILKFTREIVNLTVRMLRGTALGQCTTVWPGFVHGRVVVLVPVLVRFGRPPPRSKLGTGRGSRPCHGNRLSHKR